ncbi:unnamed protein product [Vitrella brassicaformis CCMP3155]|uniref:RxLR effector protein n=1 Tax=Vitrella brassicaformis (strain CCMP3155) TaxID=1169540 RepID=A0A0G4GLK4_VITBC|nr:unnamed protein product [Vitrella brassicaformis CCMP3155]|eukprot:CEM30958.1 unnamed protein product [Vitrella brassicaformis CCMP3155]
MTKVPLLTFALAISAVSSAPPALRGLQLGGMADRQAASDGDGEKRRLQFGSPRDDMNRAVNRAANDMKRAAEDMVNRAAEEDVGWPDDESLDEIIDGPGASGDDWEKRRLQFGFANRVKRAAERAAEEDNGWPDDESLDEIIDRPDDDYTPSCADLEEVGLAPEFC